jgi:hypothetical protein
MAKDVATRCPAMAPVATPHGDCRKGKGEAMLWLILSYEENSYIIWSTVHEITPAQHQEQLLQALSDLPIPRSNYNLVKLETFGSLNNAF